MPLKPSRTYPVAESFERETKDYGNVPYGTKVDYLPLVVRRLDAIIRYLETQSQK